MVRPCPSVCRIYCEFTAFAIFTTLSERSIAMITAEMLAPITTTLSSNLDVLLPVGIGIMGTMIGVGLIPRIVYKFL